jgi:hypothetical protein
VVEMKMRQDDVDDGDAVEQPTVGDEAANPGSGVKQESVIAQANEDRRRLSLIDWEPAAAAQHPGANGLFRRYACRVRHDCGSPRTSFGCGPEAPGPERGSKKNN